MNIEKGDIGNNMESFVWEPVANKLNVITAAFEAAALVSIFFYNFKHELSHNYLFVYIAFA